MAADDNENRSPVFSVLCTANELSRVRVCGGKPYQDAEIGRMMTEKKDWVSKAWAKYD